MEKLNNSTKKEKLQSWIWLFFMLLIFGSISYFIYWFITGISAVLETSKSDFIAQYGEENGTRLWLSFSDTVKELKWFVFLVSFAMGIICKIVFSEIYKILINKRNLTIGTSCKGRTTKISEKIIFKDFALEDEIKKDDWETTPYLHKIQIVAHYIVRYHKNDEYSLFTKVKDFSATEKIKEMLKNMFKDKDEYETILEMKLAHLLLIADGVYIEDSSCEILQSPKKYYQWILENSKPKNT